MNSFIDLAKERYSVRSFKPDTIPLEIINKVLEAARVAPTAVNYQPQRIIVFNNALALEAVKKVTKHHFNAPLVFLIGYDRSVSWKRSYDEHDMGEVDASIAGTQMMLEIAALGLGSTWVGHFNPKILHDEIELPQNFVPVAFLMAGYPSTDSKPHPYHDIKFDLQHFVTYYNEK